MYHWYRCIKKIIFSIFLNRSSVLKLISGVSVSCILSCAFKNVTSMNDINQMAQCMFSDSIYMLSRLRDLFYFFALYKLFFYYLVDVIEEEEAFQAYAEQRRYASTLSRSCLSTGSTRRRETEREQMKSLKGRFSGLVRKINLVECEVGPKISMPQIEKCCKSLIGFNLKKI